MALSSKQFDALPDLFKEIITCEKELHDTLARKAIPFADALWRIQRQRDLKRAAQKALHWDYKSRG